MNRIYVIIPYSTIVSNIPIPDVKNSSPAIFVSFSDSFMAIKPDNENTKDPKNAKKNIGLIRIVVVIMLYNPSKMPIKAPI